MNGNSTKVVRRELIEREMGWKERMKKKEKEKRHE